MAVDDIITFDYKMQKLKQIMDVCMKDGEMDVTKVRPQHVITAIEVANKMQGHIAPTGMPIPGASDEDMIRARAIMHEYETKFKRDY